MTVAGSSPDDRRKLHDSFFLGFVFRVIELSPAVRPTALFAKFEELNSRCAYYSLRAQKYLGSLHCGWCLCVMTMRLNGIGNGDSENRKMQTCELACARKTILEPPGDTTSIFIWQIFKSRCKIFYSGLFRNPSVKCIPEISSKIRELKLHRGEPPLIAQVLTPDEFPCCWYPERR